MATKFDALPAWSEVEQDERYQQLDQAGRVTTFDNWFNKLSESAVEEPEVLEGWGEMKKFARAKRVELAGGANPLDVANEEVDAEAEDEPVPARIAAAQRKRELESRITGFMGLGAEQIAKLPEEERDELTKLRSVVTKADEEDLAAIDETAQDDREFHIVDGKFYASPALALSKDKAREAVRNSNLTPQQKADALVEVAQLREQVGAKLRSEIEAVNEAFGEARAALPFGIQGPKIGGADKFNEFESLYREGNPEATDADVMEAWRKENGGWFDNIGTQIKLGTLRSVSNLVGTYYGAKRLLGDESEQTAAISGAAGDLSQQLAAGQKAVGGATLAGDAAEMVLTSLATAPAGPLGRGVMKGLQVAGRGGRLAAALTGGKVGKFALDRAARVAAGGATKASVLAREASLRAGGGLAASVFASGVQSAGGSYAQYYDQFLKDAVEDLPVELRQDPEALNIARRSARDAARARAVTAGAITALTVFAGTRLFGATGAEKLAQPDVSKALQAAKEGLAVYFAKTLSKEALGEMTEEGVDALANDIVDKAVVDPNKPISEIIENTLKSAAAGGLLGAGMATPFALRDTWEARARAKQSPEVQQAMQTADNLDAAGAPASAQALRDAVKPKVEAATQEELDAARTKAEADALAALGGEDQPAFEQATAARRRAKEELDALPPDDPAREAAQANLDELDAVISERGADAMVPVTPSEAAATTPVASPATPAAAPAAATTSAPAPSKEMFDALAVGETYTSFDGTVWTRREGQLGDPVMVSKSEGAQVRLPTADFAAFLLRSAPAEAPETPVDVNDPFGEAPPPAPTESPAAPPAEPTAATVGPQPTPGGVGTPPAAPPAEPTAATKVAPGLKNVLGKGAVVTSDAYRSEGDIVVTGDAVLEDGEWKYPANFTGTGRNTFLADRFVTTVKDAGAPTAAAATPAQPPTPAAPAPLASPVKTPPKPTPPQANDTETKEPQTGSLPTVSGQPAGQVREGQAATGAAPRASQGKADAGKKLTAVEETPQAKAEAIIREEMFKNSVIPSSATTTTRFKQLTKKGFSKGSPELKALQDRLRKAWEEAHPPEDVAPAGYFVGSTEGPEMKPLPKTVVRGSRAADNAGGAIPFKLVGGERVGLFTNNPVITAKQINAGLKITVPPNLRSKVAKGIEVDPTTGQVTAAYDYSRGNTPVTKAGDWTALYKASSSRQERAENLLKEGENIAEKTGKTVEQVTEELRQATNVVNAIAAGKKKASPAVFAEMKELQRELVKQVVAMTKSQNPRIPFVGTDAYLSQYAPDEVAGESAILKEYLQLRAPVKGEDSYVGAIVRNTVELNWPRLSDSDMLERMEFAIKNVATIKVRQSLLRNPDATPEALKASLPNIIRVANDVINKFAAADRAYRSAITGSIDDELSESDRVIAGVAVAAAQVDAEAQVTRLDAGDVASVPLTDAEAERLQTALQSMNDGVPDTVAFEILQARPLQARKALQSVASKLKFKVGSDGELIYEHGPALKEEESQALVDILKNVGPEGDTELLDRLSSLPNVARFFLDMAALGREALQKVKTPAGANMYTAKELRNMNLIGIFTAVHAGDSSTAARILKQARQNLDTYSDSASKTSAHINKILKSLLAPSSQAPSVKGRAAPASAVAERRAQEKLGTQQALVEAAREAVNFNNLEMERLTNSIRTLSDRRDELRDDIEKPNVDITKTQRELNKVIGALSRVQENYTLTEVNLADAKASLEAAVKVYESMVSKLAPPAAAVVEQTKAEVDAAVKAAEEAGDAQRRLETSPAPTKAVNAGMTAAFENPTPVNTEEEKSLFKSELSALGLGAEADVETTLNILRQMSLKGGANAGYTKFLSRMFSDNPALLNGIDGVQVVDLPVLAEDVSIVNGLLTLNVAAMTKTLDGTPRGPEALLRGLVTHAVTNLTSMGIPLTTTQQAALTKLEELRQEAAAMEPLTRAPGLAPRFTDALKDTASFVQAVLTSPEFADMLRSYRTKKVPGIKSAWGRFWAAVGEFLTGKKVDFSSGLHVSLMTAGDLMVRSPSAAKSFLDTLKAVIHNPDIAFPKGRTAGAEEINHQQRVNEAVELADSPDALDTVEARLTGDNSPEADPENVSELDAALMPSDAILGSAPVTEPKGTSRVKRAPKVRKEKPAAAPLLTEREAFAGLADAILTVRWVDRVARGVVTMSEAAKATSLDVPRAMDKLAAAVERLKASSAANKDEFIKKLEDMQAFLGSERERVMAGEAPASPAPDPVSTVAEDVETDALPAESDIPLAEVDEDAIPFAEPYIEATADDGSKQPIDFNPFLRAAAIKTGRRIAMVEAGPGVMNQPLYVRHDRTDSRIYMNKEAMTELIERLRSEGYTTAESTTYINALLDREASTLAILQRFSDGELLATARSLSDDQRRQIIDRVYGLKPGDKGYSNYFSVGRSGYSQEVTADMIQLGADYFRMMRQVSETGHTSEDVMYMAAASMGTFARTVAFLKATANQFATWWRAYGDVNATRAILNIDEFLLAVTPALPPSPAAKAPKLSKHEVTQVVADIRGKSIDEVIADAEEVVRVRKDMLRTALSGETPQTTRLSSDELEAFAKETLGLVEGDGSSVATALASISELSWVNPATRAIAAELSKNPDVKKLANLLFFVGAKTDDSGARPSGFYQSSAHTLALNLPEISNDFAYSDKATMWSQSWLIEVLVHEATHAATTIAIYRYNQGIEQPTKVDTAIRELSSLWQAVKTQPGADQFAYELSSLDEFAAAVMANSRFVSWLSSVPASVGNQIPGSRGLRSFIKRVLARIYQIVFPDLEVDSVMEKSLARIFDIASYPHVVTKPSARAFGGLGVFQNQKVLTGAGLLIAEGIYEQEALIQLGAEGVAFEAEISAAIDAQDEFELAADEIAAYEAGLAAGLRFAPAAKLPPRMLPGKVTGERKATEALKNSLPAMPTRVEEYLGESTYFSGVPKRDIEIIESLIGPRLAGATGSPEFSQIAYDIERGSLPLTDPQRFLAQVVLGNALNKRIFDLQKALVDSPTSGGIGMLEDYEQLAKDVWRSVQEVASTSGQMLHAAAVARDLINPRFISATYRDNLSTMAKKGLPKDVGDVFTDLKKEADAVSSDVVKKSPLTKKIVEAMTKATGSNPAEVQLLFDFMETLPVKILQDYRNRGTGIPIPAKMASWVADRIFNMVESKVRAQVKQVADAAGEPEQTFFEEYSNEVKRLVAVRVNDALAGVAPARQGLTPAEQEAADREALDSAIRKLVSSFEYLPSVENALNQSRAKLLSHLEAKKGSTPEALKQYEASKAAIAAMKFDLVPLSTATDIIRRSFDMREQVYLSLADQRASVVQIATMISNSAGLTEDQSRKVAEAFKAAYEAEMNRRIQKTLNSYAQRRLRFEGRGGAERYSRSERFLRLARIGGLRQEEFYNAMATEFGLPSYDPAVAKELEQEAERILAMPVGSVQRNDATRELNARIVNETYRSLLDAYGAKAVVKNKEMFWDYLAGVPVAMWKSGVLSGFGTSEVNFGFGTVQSIMDLGFNATAYAVKAKDPTLAASNVLTLMRAVGWIADPLQRKEVWTEIKRAALTGRTRFASEQSENMLVLERDIPSIDLPVIKQLMGSAKNFYKLLGRIGSVVDATVSVPASIARQRLAMQYALTMSGADRAKIKEVLRSSFTPDEMESREINQILDAEREQFRNSPRPDLAMESRRFQLLEQRRAQTYAELTSRLEAKDKEDFMDASRESARFANLGTTPTGLSGLVFDSVFGSIERKSKGLSSIIVSFPRAMGNLLDFSLAMSVPGLSFMRANNTSPSSWFLSEDSRYRREMVEKGSIKYWKLMSQGIVALAAQATIGALYYYGLEDEEEGRVPWFMVYGKGYQDSERNRQLRYRQPNWSPYTVKIGGVYLSWKDIPGFNLLLGGLASITDARMVTSLKDPKKVRKLETLINTSVAFVKAVTVKNSMQGLSQAGELLSDNDFAEAMTAANASKMLTNFVSGATNPRLLRDVASMGRGLVGGGEYTLKDTRGFTAAAISLLPANEVYGASLGQHDMLNSMGEPVTNFWFAPLTKRILPITAGPSTDPIITPLVSAGLFLSPVKASQMTFDTYENGSDEIDAEGGPLSSFGPEVEIDAIKMFGEQMRLRMTPDYIKELTDLAAEGQAGRKEAQEMLNKECADARAYAKDVIQERIFNREIKPHWQE